MKNYFVMTRLFPVFGLAFMVVLGCSDDSSGSGFEGNTSDGDGAGSGFEWNDTLVLPGTQDLTDVDLGAGGGVPEPDALDPAPEDGEQASEEGGETGEIEEDTSGAEADGGSYPDGSSTSSGDMSIAVKVEGEILSGISPIQATVTGGEWILGVEFHVDGLKVDTDVVPPYTLGLDTQAFDDGPHIIAVYTADSQGAYASATAEVLFDNSPPAILELAPGDESTVFYEDGPLSLSVEMDEPEKITELSMRVNGLLVGEFSSPPFTATVAYEDIFVAEEELPKTLFVQVSATDVLDQETEVSFNTQVHSRLRWRFDTVYEIKGSPDLLPNGNIVYGNSGGELYSMTPNGDVAWQISVGGQIKDGVTVDPETGNIYFGVIGDGNPIYGYNQDGSQLWSATFNSPPGGRIAQQGGLVYADLFSGTVLALDKTSGGTQWSVDLPESIVASPKVTPSGRIYTGCWDNKFRAIESSGVIWDFSTGDEVRSTAAVGSNAIVYFGSNDGWIYALNESDGSHVWVKEIEGNIEGEVLLVEEEGALYVASSNTYLTKMNMNTGDTIWSTKLDYIVDASPVRGADGSIYVGSQTDGLGKVFAVEPENGDIRFAYKVDAVIPDRILLVGDKLYFGANDRSFYSLWAADANLYVPEEVSP